MYIELIGDQFSVDGGTPQQQSVVLVGLIEQLLEALIDARAAAGIPLKTEPTAEYPTVVVSLSYLDCDWDGVSVNRFSLEGVIERISSTLVPESIALETGEMIPAYYPKNVEGHSVFDWEPEPLGISGLLGAICQEVSGVAS